MSTCHWEVVIASRGKVDIGDEWTGLGRRRRGARAGDDESMNPAGAGPAATPDRA